LRTPVRHTAEAQAQVVEPIQEKDPSRQEALRRKRGECSRPSPIEESLNAPPQAK